MITTKEQYQNYRETAREILADNSHGVTVSEHANVQVCEDGAFVECVVWVDKDVAEFGSSPDTDR